MFKSYQSCPVIGYILRTSKKSPRAVVLRFEYWGGRLDPERPGTYCILPDGRHCTIFVTRGRQTKSPPTFLLGVVVACLPDHACIVSSVTFLDGAGEG